jgi:hypothetical protein
VSFLGTVTLGKTPTESQQDLAMIASLLDNLAKDKTSQANFSPQHYAMCISPDNIRFVSLSSSFSHPSSSRNSKRMRIHATTASATS